jgi:hypothetical protein
VGTAWCLVRLGKPSPPEKSMGVSAEHKLLYVSLRLTNSALICYSKGTSENEVLIALCPRNVRKDLAEGPRENPPLILTFNYCLYLNLVNIAPIRFIESPTHH